MIMIAKEPILTALNTLYSKIDGTVWRKRDKIMILGKLITLVNNEEEFDPYHEDPDNFYAPPAKMIKELEPIVPHSAIGKENFYCSHCKTRVKQKDLYCRKCGHKFEK